jgi:hypothetical protein
VGSLTDLIRKSKEEQLAEERLKASYMDPLRGPPEYVMQSMCYDEAMPESEAPKRRGHSAKSMALFGSPAMPVVPTCAPPSRAIPLYGAAAPAAGSGRRMVMDAACPMPMLQTQRDLDSFHTRAESFSAKQALELPVQHTEKDSEPSQEGHGVGGSVGGGSEQITALDYTKFPTTLDQQFEKLDKHSALRPTTISVGQIWQRTSSKSLLSAPVTADVAAEEQLKEKSKAMDLLDALSRSGDLTLENCFLHVIVAATHCFEKSLMESLVRQNINPIEHMERSSLMISSTVHAVPFQALIAGPQLARVQQVSADLFIEDEEARQGGVVSRP